MGFLLIFFASEELGAQMGTELPSRQSQDLSPATSNLRCFSSFQAAMAVNTLLQDGQFPLVV